MDGRGYPNRSPNWGRRHQSSGAPPGSNTGYNPSGAPTGSNTGYPNLAGAPHVPSNPTAHSQQQTYTGAGRGASGHGHNTGYPNPAHGQQPSYTGAGGGAPGHGHNPSGAPTGSNTGYPNSAAPTAYGQPPYTGGGAQAFAPPFNLPQVRWPSHGQHQGNSQQHGSRVPAGTGTTLLGDRTENIWRAGDSPHDFGGRPTTSNAAYNPQRYYGGTTNAGAQPFGAATPAQGYGVDIPASRHAEPYHSNQALREAGGHIPPHVRSNAASNRNAYPVGHQSPRSDTGSTGSDPNMYPAGHLSVGSARSSASTEHSGSAHSSADAEPSGSAHTSTSAEPSETIDPATLITEMMQCPKCKRLLVSSNHKYHRCLKKDRDESNDKRGGGNSGGNSGGTSSERKGKA
ncbi:hypothetical protein BDP27DRAFT_1340253 [Rhodocollybia butyracea]|uniref:Uncharacterized protein n=1 Tax=Rhodocollybia butyracea TaxID=206335 RepID=A0A9P5TY25_9AGAR|nr:hypothetical protein BDP27DRAFT_1340253 [Rhodocollybia butyracea]